MTKIISYTKVDDITRILTKSYEVKEEKIKKEMAKALSIECAKHIPDEVMAFHKRWPTRLQKESTATFRYENETFYLNLDIPALPENVDAIKHIAKNGTQIYSTLVGYAQEYIIHKLEKNKIKNQIKCTLIKLKTYKRIEANFPEAYEILIYEIDKEVKQPKGLCDSVEELRAKLSKAN